MKAVTYQSLGDVQMSELDTPTPRAQELVIKVQASGICHTDIDILHGRYGSSTFPLVPGHEYAGEVVACGANVTELSEGQRVVVDPNFHCGKCRACRKGLTNLCDELGAYGVTRHGGFAEYSVVDQENVIPIANMPYGIAALAEPVACVLNGLDEVSVAACDNAMIFGAGPIGMLMALSLRVQGVEDVTMVDINDSRLALAESFGLKAIASGSAALAGQERGVDLVADATGVPAVAEGLIQYTANGGNVLFFGVCPPGELISVSPHDVFRRQIRIAGAHSLNHNIPDALATIDKIGPDIERLVSHRVELGDIKELLSKGSGPDSLKIHAVLGQ